MESLIIVKISIFMKILSLLSENMICLGVGE